MFSYISDLYGAYGERAVLTFTPDQRGLFNYKDYAVRFDGAVLPLLREDFVPEVAVRVWRV